ncbi:MAG: phenylalanine--tRNA ligase subunit beta [Caldilineaceae bacterium SB0661_bin_32]|uniref:Phenylalanine--tRNA ligase beta subunit n=1 Tax=Caldilineaceae bacterium SB0661_bin_32 TaxID=2605255 RepID=A0A6B1D192_9CHLR|nr:phenylalanine--tRNA ligase subunit beta [Caldilineaceae bacterium SB0661_bin_32]
MLVPLSWLREYVDILIPTPKLAERLTLAGLEEASLTNTGDWWEEDKIVVGQVASVLPHPDADRLVLVDVAHEISSGAGEPPLQRVVTGAPNLFQYRDCSLSAGDLPVLKVAFAREGALLVDAYSEELPRPHKRLKKAKIRGVESRGMVCSELELGLSEEHEGILLLPDDAPVGTPLRHYLGDEILEIDLTPDMARCLSMWGVAREVQALTGGVLHLPEDIDASVGEDIAGEYVSAQIDDPDLCQRFTGTVLRDIKVGESPRWLQDRLSSAGMRPINNIVDITNYVMLETGQPLHAFDYDLLAARAEKLGDSRPTIIVRTAKEGERLETLDGQERNLEPSMLVIADKAGPVAIAGVMGGGETEVHEGTTNLLLESATFDGINNRRTSQTLRLHSEASHRFTRGVPASLNELAARRAADLMQQFAGGRVVPGIVDTYPAPQPQVKVFTSRSDVKRLLGMDLSLAEIGSALQRLEFAVEELSDLPEDTPERARFGLARAEGERVIAATAPWHRLDVSLPADLTEEVARVVGYDKVSETLLDTVLPPQRRNAPLETEENIRDILIGCGLQDTVNHTLTTPENHARLAGAERGPSLIGEEENAGAASDPSRFISLTNPLSPERRVMRRNLIVSALENLAYNLRYKDRLAVFEIGRTYRPPAAPSGHSDGENSDLKLPEEQRRLCIALRGLRDPHPSNPSSEPPEFESEFFDFFDLKGIVETLLERLGFAQSEYLFSAHPESGADDAVSETMFGPRCALISLQDDELGIVGELHPQVRNAFGLGGERVVLAELKIAPLVRPSWRLSQMAPISVYPPVVEDLAFVVKEEVTQRRLRDAIVEGGGRDGEPVLASVELFDIYRGESLPVGCKSLAYRVTYQSMDHNLKEREVNRLRQRIIRTVERATGGTLRS